MTVDKILKLYGYDNIDDYYNSEFSGSSEIIFNALSCAIDYDHPNWQIYKQFILPDKDDSYYKILLLSIMGDSRMIDDNYIMTLLGFADIKQRLF